MDVQNYKGKFTGKEAGYFLLTLASALALWLYVAANNRKEAVADIRSGLLTINNYKNSEIHDWRIRRITEARRLSEHPFLGQILSEEIAKPGSRRAQLNAWLKGHTAHKMYAEMAFLSPDGTIITGTPGYPAAAGKYFKDAFARAYRERTALLTDLYLALDGRPRLAMISPISAEGRSGKPVCVLVTNIDPETEFYPLVKAEPLLYTKAETLLVRKDGEDVLFLNELVYSTGTALKLRHPLSDAGLPAAAALRGYTGFFSGMDYRGEKVFSAVSHIADSGWAVVTKIDRDEVLAPVKARERLQLALILAVACLFYIVVYYVLRSRRLAAEEILVRSQHLLAETEKLGKVGGWEFDIGTRKQIWTEEVYRIHELDPSFSPDVEKGINFYTPESRPIIEGAVRHTLETREGFDLQLEIITAKNNLRSVQVIGKADLEHRRVYGFFQDITDRVRTEKVNSARLRLIQFSDSHTLDELLEEALNEAEKLTGSLIGFYHFVEPDQKTLSLQNWSTRTKKEYCKAEGKGSHYGIDKAGVWTDCVRERRPVIHNDYASLPAKKGLPAGHAPLIRELVVPVMREGKIVSIMGVGNKPGDYNEKDIDILSLLADLSWEIVNRKRAEEGLRESEERFRTLFDKSPFPAIVHAEDGEVLRVNKAWEEMSGYAHAEIPTIAAWTEKAYGTKRSLVLEDIEKLYGITDRKAEGEYTIRAKDGSEKIWDFSSAPLGKIKDGRRTVISMANDMTARKLAETKLRESQRVFSEFMEHSPIYVFFKDKDLRALNLSLNYEKMLGRPMEELIGKNMDELFPSDLAKSMLEDDKRILREGKEVVVEEEMNGRSYRTIKFPIKIEGRAPYLAGYTIDITEQKQAEAEIKRNLYLLDRTGELGKIGGWDIDVPSMKVTWSRETRVIHETAPDFMPDIQTAINFYAPGDRPVIEAAVKAALEEQKPFDLILTIITAKGNRAFVNAIGIPEVRKGKTVRLWGTFQDISERKLAEERLRILSDMVPGVVYQYRLYPDGRSCFPYASTGMNDIYEVTPEEVREDATPVFGRIHPDDLKSTSDAIMGSARENSIFHWEFRVVLPRQGLRWRMCDARPERMPDGSTLWYGIITDITARRQAEAALEKYAAELQEAHTVAKMGSYYFDLAADNWDCSAQLARIFGIEDGDYPKNFKLWTELVHPEDRDGMRKYFNEEVSAGKNDFNRRYRIVRQSDKAERWVHGFGKLKLDQAGKVAAMYGLIQDITEVRLAELELQRLNQDLAARKQEMENFLYITTHDLRSPLVNIQGFTQNLVRYIQELREDLSPEKLPQAVRETVSSLASEKIPEALKYVLESSQKMDSLISSLLKVARLGRVEMKPEILDMNDLVKKISESVRFQGEKAGVSIKTGVLPPCRADQTAVSQIFANLLGNAIKYRDRDRALEISITGEAKDGRILYAVADNGSGITAKDLPRIWDLFFRGGTPGMEGEGIGLTVVKYMAEKNGGSIRVESKEGQGSVFFLELPAAGGQK
ncbi:MAG: PAS domain S-box protein [Elusimicrobiales bacterium]|nr:PAS domain S-box protein [Elusimicrobiales bacterium]